MLARFVAGLGGCCCHFAGGEPVVFCVADLGANRARRIIVGRKIQLRERALYGGSLVVIIVNREIARQTEMMRFAADQARAEGMKSRDPNVRSVAPGRA